MKCELHFMRCQCYTKSLIWKKSAMFCLSREHHGNLCPCVQIYREHILLFQVIKNLCNSMKSVWIQRSNCCRIFFFYDFCNVSNKKFNWKQTYWFLINSWLLKLWSDRLIKRLKSKKFQKFNFFKFNLAN